MPALPAVFTTTPIAHRGLHGDGIPENSLAAARAAIDAGYGIEIDIQPALDGTPMVFHDYDLSRLAGDGSFIRTLSVQELSTRRLAGGSETIPELAALLDLVAGQVPLLIEIKDPDGRLGDNIGDLHDRVAQTLKGYEGPVAVMSFNPHVAKAFGAVMPEIPVGLTTCGFAEKDWAGVPQEVRERLAAIADFDDAGACFVSHDRSDLTNPRIDALKAQGVPILCWTIRSQDQEDQARRIADNITFEGYRAKT